MGQKSVYQSIKKLLSNASRTLLTSGSDVPGANRFGLRGKKAEALQRRGMAFKNTQARFLAALVFGFLM
jgi:hypothetical protein